MLKNWKYLKYIFWHKLCVYQYGRKVGLPVLQLLIHDWQKFMPSEWVPYREFFYGERDHDAFLRAWNHHLKYGPHHWQYWVLIKDDGTTKCLPMPDKYRREMVADWRGAGRAITGKEDALKWYTERREGISLHKDTRRWLEKELGYELRS